jgi:hypothetical protein
MKMKNTDNLAIKKNKIYIRILNSPVGFGSGYYMFNCKDKILKKDGTYRSLLSCLKEVFNKSTSKDEEVILMTFVILIIANKEYNSYNYIYDPIFLN